MNSGEDARLEIVREVLRAFRVHPEIGVANGTVSLVAGVEAGDDCAVLRAHGDVELVAGTDYVRGPRFRLFELGLLSHYDLGYFLAVANLSDIAAMGARPLALLSVLRYDTALSDEDFRECLMGMRDACEAAGAAVIGGDIGTAERLILSGAALGIRRAGSSFYRSSARVTDRVYVSGNVGRAAAALVYFQLRALNEIPALDRDAEEELLAAWRRPRPRFDIASVLSSLEARIACQDVSDGLRASVEGIATASGVGVVLREADLPIATCVSQVARLVGISPSALALSASVDFELVCALPIDIEPTTFDVGREGLKEIGACIDTPGCHLIDRAGVMLPLPGVPWLNQDGDVVRLILDGAGRRAN